MFEVPSLNVIYGSPGSLKSFLLADLSICVASGNGWLPPLPNVLGAALPVSKGSVVWFDFDNGKRRTHDRFSALGKTLKLPDDTPLHYYSMPTPLLNAGNIHHIEQVIEIVQYYQAKLVTIDNLGVISGGADENTAAMISVLSNLRRLVEETGIVLNVIHHSRKSGTNNGRKGDSLRGHSSIEASLDLALLVDRPEGSNTIKIIPTKVRGAEVKQFTAKFTYLNDDNRQLQDARFYGGKGDDPAVMAERMRLIYECSTSEPQNKTDLTQKAHDASNGKYGINLLGKDIDMMVDREILFRTNGKYNAQLLTRNPNKQP